MSPAPDNAVEGADAEGQTGNAGKARRCLPLAPQIVVLLLGGLVIAQLTTLCLTLALPPEPQAKYSLDDVAGALRGGSLATAGSRPLVRAMRGEPPSSQSPGWLVSEQSRDDLARLTGASPADVRLLYYSPLPFAGATGRKDEPARVQGPNGRPLYAGSITTLAALLPGPIAGPAVGGGNGGGPGGGVFPGDGPVGNGFPGGGFPGGPQGSRSPPGRGFPGGAPDGSFPGGGFGSVSPGFPGSGVPSGAIPIDRGATTGAGAQGGSPFSAILTPLPGATTAGAAGMTTSAGPPPSGVQATLPPPQAAGWPAGQGAASVPRQPQFGIAPPVLIRSIVPALQLPVFGAQSPSRDPRGPASYHPPLSVAPAAPPGERAPDKAKLAPDAGAPSDAPVAPTGASAADPAVAQPQVAASADPSGYPLPSEKDQAHGPFGAVPSPFVAGDFVAALRVGPGRWVVVQPKPEPFPNSWQRRIILWFLLSSAAVIPLGILFARRLAAPLSAFAAAAESLGKDPRALPTPTVSGTTEIARAAVALNQMQVRLRRFIEDRTAMVGAISHDLRTPLARMRFRLERAPEDVRAGMLHDISQMEAMLSGVLAFIRDASEVTVRERIELRSLLECVVDNAALTGGDVVLDPGGRMPVDIDCLSVERVLTNLVDNALKYGERARVRMFEDGADVIAEIEDDGPGLPPSEIERAFEPFYRSDHSRGLNKAGIGLGLAVSRSIARAHGGDVKLSAGERGLKAQLRLPKAKAA